MHLERTFSVARPVAEVFDYLADFTTTNEWDPGTVKTTRTGGDGGLGTTYTNVSEFMGRRVELAYETIVHEPHSQVKIRGVNGATTATDWFRFEAIGESGTSIHYRADFDFSPVLRVVAPIFIRGKLDRLADETIEQMKQVLSPAG